MRRRNKKTSLTIKFLTINLIKLYFSLTTHIHYSRLNTVNLRYMNGNVTSPIRNIPPTELLTFRPTAISDLRQLFNLVLFEG